MKMVVNAWDQAMIVCVDCFWAMTGQKHAYYFISCDLLFNEVHSLPFETAS